MKILKTRSDFFKLIPKNSIIAEIGVFKGDFAKEIVKELAPKELYLIDIFEGRMGSGDKDGNNMEFVILENCYNNLKLFFNTNENVKLLKGYSSKIIPTLEDNYFDFVYIDASHEYVDVKNDLNLSYDKIKHLGYIGGHDFEPNRFPGVTKAVYEFCNEKNLKINYITEDGCPSFLIQKL